MKKDSKDEKDIIRVTEIKPKDVNDIIDLTKTRPIEVTRERRKQLSPTIGLFLKKLRISYNYKQAVVAEAVGVSQAYIGLIEKGMRLPSVEVLRAYAEVFTSVSIEELLNLREMTIFETVELLGDETPPAIKNERNMLVHSIKKSDSSFVADEPAPYFAVDKEKEKITVKFTIKKDGTIELDGKPIDPEDVTNVLNEIREKHISEQK